VADTLHVGEAFQYSLKYKPFDSALTEMFMFK